MESVFEVKIDLKASKKCLVQIRPDVIDVKPVDVLQGKRRELETKRVVACQVWEQDKIRLTYCSGARLECKRIVLTPVQPGDDVTEWVQAICKLSNIGTDPDPKKALVLINPASGQGKAVSRSTHILKSLKEAGMELEVVFTQAKGHAEEVVRTLKEINQFNCFLVLSGDGLIHEVINGLYQRGEGVRLLKTIAIGAFPLGSGNAMCRSLEYQQKVKSNVKIEMLHSLSHILRGQVKPLDLFKLIRDSAATRLGFLSLGYGLIADVDIESEPLRPVGDLRFVIWALIKMVNHKKYRAKVSYLPSHADADTIPDYLAEEVDSSWVQEEDDFVCIYVVNLPMIDASNKLAPDCSSDDGYLWMLIIRKEVNRKELLKVLTLMEEGKHTQVNNVELVKTKAVRIEPKTSQGHMTVDGEAIAVADVQVSVLPGAARIFLQ